jgi:nicotinate-nucleotide pyrophosphorylase (carboxylating)
MTLPDMIVQDLVAMALREDWGRAGDITGLATIPADKQAQVVMNARDAGVIAGLDFARSAFLQTDPGLNVKILTAEGSTVAKKKDVMIVTGNARAILAAERVALNFVGRLSGIATLTAKMADAAKPHKAKIAATRKTTPGLRAAEKYAVILGGGLPHRYGLDDAILIKDNHIAIAGGILPALRAAKKYAGHTVKVEIEVDNLDQLNDVIAEGADIVMLDNMSFDDMREAVRRVNGKMLVEASGGVTLERIPQIAATGVDLISSGAITHSVPNFDVGLDFKSL